MNYKIFQYVPMSKPKALVKMLPKIISLNANIVLDLEDSIQDTLNPENTKILKNEARNSISILLDDLINKNITLNDSIYIRINSFESGELENDIKIIKEVCKKVKKIGLFIPMVKKVEDIYFIKNLLVEEYHNIKIVPIIETVNGYNSLEEILINAAELNIEFIHYGHYDYSFDSKQWPFIEQNEKQFWNFIKKIIDNIEKSSISYMHTPFGHLTDEKLYKSIIKKLTKICNKNFAITALNYNQVLFAQDIQKADELEYCKSIETDKYQLAQDIINIFENNQCSKRSFSVDIKKAKFLTPHEYKMAKQYLEGLENGRN